MSKHLTAKLLSVSALALATTLLIGSSFLPATAGEQTRAAMQTVPAYTQTQHRTIDVDGLEIFYREAGPVNAPTILLLHGFPTSSHMFRNLIPALSDRFHVVALDYPGFGNSAMPGVDEFDYTFDKLADVTERFTEKLGLQHYSLYLMDYGAPIGFRLAERHPERVDSLIVQNGTPMKKACANSGIRFEPTGRTVRQRMRSHWPVL